MTLKEFYKKLERADWYYERSDDYSVWRKGQEEINRLEVIAKQSSEHQDLYDKYRSHVFSGNIFNTEQTPKPEEPE